MGKFWQNKSLSLLIHELTFLTALLHHLTLLRGEILPGLTLLIIVWPVSETIVVYANQPAGQVQLPLPQHYINTIIHEPNGHPDQGGGSPCLRGQPPKHVHDLLWVVVQGCREH